GHGWAWRGYAVGGRVGWREEVLVSCGGAPFGGVDAVCGWGKAAERGRRPVPSSMRATGTAYEWLWRSTASTVPLLVARNNQELLRFHASAGRACVVGRR